MRTILFALFCLIGVGTPLSAQNADSLYARDLLPVGTVAPDLIDHEGKVISLEKFRGHCVVLDFWATWCPDCRKDIPEMKKLHQLYDMKGVEFIGVSFDQHQETLNNYLEKENIRWRQVSEFKKWKETKLSKDYHINWIPTMYLIDTDGKVALATVEIEKLKEKLKTIELVKPELAGQDKMPQFVGGMPMLMKFLSANVKYPEIAERFGIEGKVVVKFFVEKDGQVLETEIENSKILDIRSAKFERLSPLEKSDVRNLAKQMMEKEALRVANKLPKWEPALRRGKPVRVKYSLPFTFRLK